MVRILLCRIVVGMNTYHYANDLSSSSFYAILGGEMIRKLNSF
jgi:hypothetical protein